MSKAVSRRYAIISDLHSNVEALTNVLADIKSQGVEDIICLGDVVGYGPQPREVLAMAMKTVRVSLMGNHDEAVLKGEKNFNAWAREAIDWTREAIQVQEGRKQELKDAFWNARPYQPDGLYDAADLWEEVVGMFDAEPFHRQYEASHRQCPSGHPCATHRNYQGRQF